MLLNCSNPATLLIHVLISNDFTQVVFTDEHENFILERRDGYSVQKKLTQLEDKLVQYVEESPPGESGFYFMECKDYDKSIKVIHSNREKKIYKILRNVEPDSIRIFDFNIQTLPSELEGYQKRIMRVLTMRDEEFIFDYIEYDEKHIKPEEETSNSKMAI